jgi:hypothetical protein
MLLVLLGTKVSMNGMTRITVPRRPVGIPQSMSRLPSLTAMLLRGVLKMAPSLRRKISVAIRVAPVPFAKAIDVVAMSLASEIEVPDTNLMERTTTTIPCPNSIGTSSAAGWRSSKPNDNKNLMKSRGM